MAAAAAQPAMNVADSRLLERFDVGHVIFQGGFAQVATATDRASGTRCACKKISKALHESFVGQRATQRTLEVYEMLKLANHPNTVEIYYASADAQSTYVVMPWIHGENLLQYSYTRHPLPREQIATIMEGVFEALKHLHDNNLVHRDIKEDNLIVTRDASGNVCVVLVDFDLCVSVRDAEHLREPPGHFPHMAPETIVASHFSSASDMWDAGVIMYRVLMNRFPFEVAGLSRGDALQKIEKGYTIDALMQQDHEACDLIHRLLAEHPYHRITADDALHRPFVSQGVLPAPNPAPMPPNPPTRPPENRPIDASALARRGLQLQPGVRVHLPHGNGSSAAPHPPPAPSAHISHAAAPAQNRGVGRDPSPPEPARIPPEQEHQHEQQPGPIIGGLLEEGTGGERVGGEGGSGRGEGGVVGSQQQMGVGGAAQGEGGSVCGVEREGEEEKEEVIIRRDWEGTDEDDLSVTAGMRVKIIYRDGRGMIYGNIVQQDGTADPRPESSGWFPDRLTHAPPPAPAAVAERAAQPAVNRADDGGWGST
ncbi:unnamed protein product [Vitrella brassicaformis CCMP3155]|uniref:Protein kinase domain-containing protein n=2 Tax=Vitrella brassicaformis TaxID=1169539 RepID=A0A0G4G2Y4_VITBC|nr:unnamed protein product [Vitrella brassicaformis CCMP3155]|eukprot:CEM22573.1 unnamed protein product [Vitrella brassicaformis CCMP3155]